MFLDLLRNIATTVLIFRNNGGGSETECKKSVSYMKKLNVSYFEIVGIQWAWAPF